MTRDPYPVILVAPSDMYAHATYQGGVLHEELMISWLEFQDSDSILDVILDHPGILQLPVAR